MKWIHDGSSLRKIAFAFIVNALMVQTLIPAVRGDVHPPVIETIIRSPLFVEDVGVIDGAIVNYNIRARLNQAHVVFGHRNSVLDGVSGECMFLSRIDCGSVSHSLISVVLDGIQGLIRGQHDFHKTFGSDMECRCDTKVFHVGVDAKRPADLKLLNEGRRQGHISAELPLFRIVGGIGLPASMTGGDPGEHRSGNGGGKREGNSDRRYPVMQVAMLLVGLGCAGVGFWQMFSPRRNEYGPLRVIALLLAAWCLLVAGGIWFGLTVGPFALPIAAVFPHDLGLSV
jgi:hypothetical protein